MFDYKYRYAFILVLSASTYLCTILCELYTYFNIHISWYYAFSTIVGITIATWECNRLIRSRTNYPSRSNKIRYLAVFFIAGSVATTIATTILVFVVGIVLNNYTIEETLVPLKLNLIYAWLVNLLFHLLNAIVFYFQEYKKAWIEAEQLKTMSTQAELQLIKSQINPHFLFNNLNVLSTLILQNNAEANRFIEEFSKVYRYILSNHDKELVELETELRFIGPYIFLLEKRFGTALKVDFDIPEEYFRDLIVPVALQMLIENAIKHNVVSRKNPLHIELSVNHNRRIVVTNNLQAKQTKEVSTGIGLQNIIRRYAMVTNDEVRVHNESETFRVALPLVNPN